MKTLIISLLVFTFQPESMSNTGHQPCIVFDERSYFTKSDCIEDSVIALDELRLLYLEAFQQEEKAGKMLHFFKSKTRKSPVEEAYHGAFYALSALHKKMPVKRLSLVKKAKKHLKKAVKSAPEQIEIRFLRFSLNHYLPDLFKNEKMLQEDQAQLLKLFRSLEETQQEPELLQIIAGFMLSSQRCTEEENRVYQRYLNK
ncbi:hypothetical protein AAG747_11275 [Rapidithrix thailandica]|uniref:Uncharacterized protein n=1 Tax=Rapidithrix thailandica TaxID=413964 RepID=A0AAW9S7Y9_9BACT